MESWQHSMSVGPACCQPPWQRKVRADMQIVDDRRERLARMIDLARAYRGWTRSEIARALDRDPGKILPESGNPKLDLVVGLADALDWPIGEVAEDLGSAAIEELPDRDFQSLDAEALACHRAGDWRGMVRTARRMMLLATDSIRRAVACNRAAGGYDGLGLYTRSLPFLQNGLNEPALPAGLRQMLSVNLANAHYAMWHLVESRAASRDLLDAMAEQPVNDRRGRVCRAFANYVRGSSARRQAQLDPVRATALAAEARPDLYKAMTEYEDLADEFSDDRYAALANTCRGALIEVDALQDRISSDDAVGRLMVALDRVVDVEQHQPGDWLESWGWWCIYGCNITLRCESQEHVSRRMAIFTNKAMEIADRLENWSLRERAFAMELTRHNQAPEEPWVLDNEELRNLVGTMGRFPAFRDKGYRILKNARLVTQEGGAKWLGT